MHSAFPPAAAPAGAGRLVRGAGYVLGSALCLAPKPVLIRWLLDHGLDSTSVLELRFLVATPLCLGLALAAVRAEGRVPLRGCVGLLLLGAVGFAAAAWLDVLGLTRVSVRAERLVLGIAPTLVVLGAALQARRLPAPRLLLALLLTYGGLVLTLPPGRGGAAAGEDPAGIACIAGSAACWALYLVGSAAAIRQWGTRRTTAIALSGACALLLALAVGHRPGAGAPALATLLRPAVLLPLLALGTLATVVPFVLLSRGIALLGPSRAAILGLIGPVTTLVLGALVLHEGWTPRLMLGAAGVLGGGLLLALPRPAASPITPAPAAPVRR